MDCSAVGYLNSDIRCFNMDTAWIYHSEKAMKKMHSSVNGLYVRILLMISLHVFYTQKIREGIGEPSVLQWGDGDLTVKEELLVTGVCFHLGSVRYISMLNYQTNCQEQRTQYIYGTGQWSL